MTRDHRNLGITLLTMSPFYTVFPALLLFLGAMSDTVQGWCLDGEGTAAGILNACRTWCVLMFGAIALGVVLTLAVTALAAKALKRRGASGMGINLLKMAVLPLAVELLICGAMLRIEVLPLMQRTGPDLRQIASGELAQHEVWFLPGGCAAHLPGYFGPEKDLMQYQVRNSAGETFTIYIPAALDFTPEGTYQSSQDETWNLENIPRYQVELTEQFGLTPETPERIG